MAQAIDAALTGLDFKFSANCSAPGHLFKKCTAHMFDQQ